MARIENRYGRATAEQIDGYGDHFTPLDPAEVGELKSLRQKALDAKRAVEAFEKPRRLDLRIAVRNAINVKTEEALAAETG
jgi:hypothetical protein